MKEENQYIIPRLHTLAQKRGGKNAWLFAEYKQEKHFSIGNKLILIFGLLTIAVVAVLGLLAIRAAIPFGYFCSCCW